jgi:hypothetical protein
MPPHVIDNMIVLRFLDGDQMVPFWWGNLAAFRQGPEHGDFAPPLPYTLAEAREVLGGRRPEGHPAHRCATVHALAPEGHARVDH